MRVYNVGFEDQVFVVEAPSIEGAISAWRDHVREETNDPDFDGDPSAAVLISDHPVIRSTAL